ncbi:MAG TPA: S9 family peptidase [Acidimicrobiales bacterium]|nr:S9 family peptidase [Acidimicrobiales bacterium]
MSAELIPRRVLFGNPDRAMATISPDGSRLAWLAPVDGVLNVWVGPVSDPDRAGPVTEDRDRGIRTYLWAHDSRHLLYLQDRGGDENWRLYGVDLERGGVSDLTPFDGVQAQPIAASPRRPGEILVGLNRDNPALHDAYRLDLETGRLELVGRNDGFGSPTGNPWVADADLQIRAVVRPAADGGGYELCVPDGEEWRPVQAFDYEDSLTTAPLAVSGDGSSLYMLSSRAANTARLVQLDFATGEERVVAGDPSFDVGDVLFDPDSRRPLIVGFVRDRLEHFALEPSLQDDLQAVAGITTGELHIDSTDDANRRWMVTFVADDGPARTYLFDRQDRSATHLFDNRPELSGYRLAAMEPFTFSARDGLTIHGYLTFPPGADRKDLPAVLNVHGGPWARDVWGFNPEAQWLANRGYLCIQVNYRGSTGYGKNFTNAGDRQWGTRMHDDLLDAVEHVVGQGYADGRRVCIYGGSYGGYAALVGAAFTPDVFRCAVDIVGPSNLNTLLNSVPPYWLPLIEQFNRRVGNRDSEQEFLWSRSPLSRVDDIRIPLLIAQGANDPRVKQAEAEQIVTALQEKGIDHTYMLFPDEGHGFAKPENRLKFYAAAEQFLAQHLGGRAER